MPSRLSKAKAKYFNGPGRDNRRKVIGSIGKNIRDLLEEQDALEMLIRMMKCRVSKVIKHRIHLQETIQMIREGDKWMKTMKSRARRQSS